MRKFQSVLALTLLIMTTSAKADLTLTLDTTNKTFAVNGSITGTPSNSLGNGFWSWRAPASVSMSSIVSYNNDQAFSTDVGSPGGSFGFDTRLQANPGSGGLILFEFLTNTADAQTINGTGVFQSYASFSSEAQTSLEALIGDELIRTQGTASLGNISVQSAAVPEPSSFLFLAIMVTGAAGRRWYRMTELCDR